MKTQVHNEGELQEIKVKIEKKVAQDLEIMSKNSGIKVEDIVVIALKRFRASHNDYMKTVQIYE